MKTNNISLEKTIGILPNDEESLSSTSYFVDTLNKNKSIIDSVPTRKSDDYYANLKENEGPKEESVAPTPYTVDDSFIVSNISTSTPNNFSSGVSSVNGMIGAVVLPVVPTGSGMEWYTDSAPDGWLLQNGQAVSRVTYANLFSVIGTTFGIGDGSTTFNLPNRTKKVPVGAGDGLSIGDTGGEWDHTHDVTVPGHFHGLATGADLAIGTSGSLHTHTTTVGNQSANHTHTLSSGATAAATANHTHTYSGTTDAGTIDVQINASSFAGGRPGTVSNSVGTQATRPVPGLTYSGTTDTSSSTSHTHNLSSLTLNNQSASHTHTVTVNTSGSDHTHNITGRIGLVTGGVDGNTNINLTSTTKNQAYIVVRWIIKT